MTRATWRQKYWGLRKKDRAGFKLTEETAIAAAVKAANEGTLSWLPQNPTAFPTVDKGRIVWRVSNEIGSRRHPSVISVDDENGEILGIRHFRRNIDTSLFSDVDKSKE